jgi:hypothetical protein
MGADFVLGIPVIITASPPRRPDDRARTTIKLDAGAQRRSSPPVAAAQRPGRQGRHRRVLEVEETDDGAAAPARRSTALAHGG